MDRNTPPSPAPTSAELLPTGFNELLQHNAAAAFPRQPNPAEPIHAHSQPVSRYGTPVAQPQHPQGLDGSIAHQHLRGGGDQSGYQQQAPYQQDNSPYGPIPEPYSTPATSPPTPSRGSDAMATRSGSGARGGDFVAKVLGPRSTRIEKSTPKRKKERAKPPKNMPVLDKPMSELTKDSTIPVADIESYVNRSSATRQQEVDTGKNPGRVKRPMNAFMLYRKAYQQRAKEWASQHNHQVVSRVCGMSWPLEPEHIRQQFKAWADAERDNHHKAHPNYKFTPSKPNKPAKFEGGFDDHSDGSDLEGYDWAAGRGISRMRSATHTPGADSDYIPSRSVYAATHPHPHHQLAGLQHAMGMMQQQHHHTRSAASFDFGPGKPMAAAYDHRELAAGPYYDAHLRTPPQQRHPLHHGGMVEDVLIHRTPSPSLAFPQPQQQPPNVALHSHYGDPLGQYHHHIKTEPLGPSPPQQHHHQQQHQQHQHHLEHRIDPSLMPHADDGLFDTGAYGSGVPGMFDSGSLANTQTQSQTQQQNQQQQQAWQTAAAASQLGAGAGGVETGSGGFLGLDETLSLEQHAQFLRGADEWQIEPLPETAHFDTSWVEPKVE